MPMRALRKQRGLLGGKHDPPPQTKPHPPPSTTPNANEPASLEARTTPSRWPQRAAILDWSVIRTGCEDGQRMDFDFPPADDPRRLEIRSWLAAHPKPSPRDLLERGLIVPHWPAPYGLGADPMHQIIIDEELAGRCRGAEQPDRHRLGGADDPARRHRGAEAALPARDPQRRGDLVPAVQRTRRRLRPGVAGDPGRTRRRRVRHQRLQDLDERRASVEVRHPHRPHRPGRAQAPGHLVLHLPDGPARA